MIFVNNYYYIIIIIIIDKKVGAKRPREATEKSPVAVKIKSKTEPKTPETAKLSSLPRYYQVMFPYSSSDLTLSLHCPKANNNNNNNNNSALIFYNQLLKPFNPLTPKISLVILLTVYRTVLVMLV